MHLVLAAKEIVVRPMAELSVPQPSLSPRKPVPPWGRRPSQSQRPRLLDARRTIREWLSSLPQPKTSKNLEIWNVH